MWQINKNQQVTFYGEFVIQVKIVNYVGAY